MIYSLLVFFTIVSCSEYDPEVSVGPRPDLTAVDVLLANDYTILVDALVATGTDLGSDSVTIFAPTNAAFQKLFGELGVAGINEIDNAVLTQVLQYHVVSDALFSSELGGSTSTLSGQSFNVVVVGDNININGKASVIDADRVSVNGVIHGINQVLSAPADNLVDVLAANPDYTFLSAAIVRAGLGGTLSGSTELTILAPNNEAFMDAQFNDLDSINATDPAILADILSFHVISGRSYSQQFADGRLATILGVETNGQEELNVSGLTFNGSEVAQPNMNATNGVVHGVNAVVLPFGTHFEFVDPNTDTPKSDIDDSGPNGLDNFGTIVEGLAYERLIQITNNTVVYIPDNGVNYGSFANDDDAEDYLERYLFEGDIVFHDLDNGTRVTSLGGDEYYIAIDSDGDAWVNGRSNNAVDPGDEFVNYDGIAARYTSMFTPLPKDSIADVLDANGYTLMADALRLTGRNVDFASGDCTFFTVTDAEFTDATGISDLTGVDPDDEANASLIEFLEELVDRHTINSANFSVYVASEIPTLTNALGEEIFFALVDDQLVIVEDTKDVSSTEVELGTVDILFADGVIHEIERPLELD